MVPFFGGIYMMRAFLLTASAHNKEEEDIFCSIFSSTNKVEREDYDGAMQMYAFAACPASIAKWLPIRYTSCPRF